MNSDQKELFRLAILRVLDANRTRFGFGVSEIAMHLFSAGFNRRNFNNDEAAFRAAILDQLEYLTEKGLIEEPRKLISGENRTWKIAPAGIAFIDEH